MLGLARRSLPPGLLATLRRLNRLRWVTKYRLLRRSGRGLLTDRMLGLRYVLLDPEVESYTYELANERELAAAIATVFAVSSAEVEGYFQETHQDPELGDALGARLRWRFASKRRLPLGNRAIWYAIARIQKPRLVVETGILTGIGSLALLRALERNAIEGHEGQLISVDSDPTAGWIVPEQLSSRWTKVIGISTEVLPAALRDRRVDLFIHDSPHTFENQQAEFAIAIEHAASPVVLVDCGGGQTPALQEVCRAHNGTLHALQPRPLRHVYEPSSTDVAIIDGQRGS